MLFDLCRILRNEVSDAALRNRCFRLAKNIFANRWVSSRKQAARRLARLGGPKVQAYVEGHILDVWRKLSRSMTNNAAERFNRKIQKAVAPRYGLPTVQSAQVLLRALWLKELILNGRRHIEEVHHSQALSIPKLCQQHLRTDVILHFPANNHQQHIDLAA